jgi:hypothetical protein
VTRPVYDPADTTSRHLQITNSVQAKLDEAAIARAKLPPSADEVALLKSLEGLVVPTPPRKAS